MSKKDNVVPLGTGKVETHEPATIGDNHRSEAVFAKVLIIEGEETRWKITFDAEHEIELSSDEVLSQALFIKRCFAKFHVPFRKVSEEKWHNLIASVGAAAKKEEENPDTSEAGQFLSLLSNYLTNRSKGERAMDLWSGRPWEDTLNKNGARHWFTMAPLQKYLEQERRDKYRSVSTSKLGSMIRALGGGPANCHTDPKDNKIQIWAWWVPSKVVQAVPEIDPPKIREEEDI